MKKKASKDGLSRRDFIKTTALGMGAAAALGGLAAGDARATEKPETWDREADVVILGTGMAGLSAAITAHDAGAKVLILEKVTKEFEGGNSKVAGNMWWTPTNVPQGIEYISAMSYGLTDQESIKALADELYKNNDWLAGLGVSAQADQHIQSRIPRAARLDRGQNVGEQRRDRGRRPLRPYKKTGGKPRHRGVYETPAREPVQNGKVVVGVVADRAGKSINVRAGEGVILACGGFEFDFAMQRQYLPAWPIYSIGSTANTGDGVRMAQEAGAALWHMNNALAGVGAIEIDDPRLGRMPIPIYLQSNGHILVDKAGKRFINEKRPARHGFGQKEYLFFFDAIHGQDFPRIPCYAIFDAAMLRAPLVPSGWKFGWFSWYANHTWSKDNSAEIEKGWILAAPTVAELAGKLKMKPETLQATMDTYNSYCDAKKDPEFDRPAKTLVRLDKPLFAAVRLFPMMYNTQGGPKRNSKCEVVDPFDRPIPRLYSAGELGSFWGWIYNGGGNLTECMATGRVAGRNVAAGKPWK